MDDNCDGLVDNVSLIDADGDGYFANPADPAQADCDDANPNINPGRPEIVDGIDNNCNYSTADPTVVLPSDSGLRGNDGFDNDCNGVIDG